jgi:hypothetical protein
LRTYITDRAFSTLDHYPTDVSRIAFWLVRGVPLALRQTGLLLSRILFATESVVDISLSIGFHQASKVRSVSTPNEILGVGDQLKILSSEGATM